MSKVTIGLSSNTVDALKKLDEDGPEGLTLAELHYIYSVFCSVGATNIDAGQARTLAHSLVAT